MEALLSPTKQRGVEVWQRVVSECDTIDKTQHKITESLQQIDDNIANAGTEAVNLLKALKEYRESVAEFSGSLQVLAIVGVLDRN